MTVAGEQHARGPRQERVIGAGFPETLPIPTAVSACGDGIHVAAMAWNQKADCVCDRMTIGPLNGPRFTGAARVILLDAVMDGTEIGDTRTSRGRRGAPVNRWMLRAPILVAGWYLMMAYPLDSSPKALALSIAVGTLGAVVIGITCYRAGRADS